MNRPRLWAPALVLTLLDGLWAAQALSAVPRNTASTVSLASLIVWMVFHLPAALLASAILKLAGVLGPAAAALPPWAFGLMGALGLAQTFGLALGLGVWWRRRKA